MKKYTAIRLNDVQNVYSGPEGRLWELLMGEQIHIGGFASSMDLADSARIERGQRGVDLCCASGAGMRFLVRFRGVERMTGVDATHAMVELGRRRCALDWRCRFRIGSQAASTVWPGSFSRGLLTCGSGQTRGCMPGCASASRNGTFAGLCCGIMWGAISGGPRLLRSEKH